MDELKNLELEMFSLFEMTPDLVCIAGKDGFFRKINPAVISKLGYTKQELFSRPIESFIHPEDKEKTSLQRENLLNGEPLINFQNRYVASNGRPIWLQWTSIYVADKEVVFAIAKDVTETKQLEKEIEQKYLMYKGLANHFKTSIETDRKYFAIELHEELAQLAAAVKMDIDWVASNTPELPHAVKSRMDHASAISGVLINTIRRISFSVSPNMLDDLGLNESLKWLCSEFSILHNIDCTFESNYDETHLSHEVQLDFFRICQEALNNVSQHADAKAVKITIEEKGDKICLSIIDDGKGFNTKIQKQKTGIKNMLKRAASINVELSIESKTEMGTKVSVLMEK